MKFLLTIIIKLTVQIVNDFYIKTPNNRYLALDDKKRLVLSGNGESSKGIKTAFNFHDSKKLFSFEGEVSKPMFDNYLNQPLSLVTSKGYWQISYGSNSNKLNARFYIFVPWISSRFYFKPKDEGYTISTEDGMRCLMVLPTQQVVLEKCSIMENQSNLVGSFKFLIEHNLNKEIVDNKFDQKYINKLDGELVSFIHNDLAIGTDAESSNEPEMVTADDRLATHTWKLIKKGDSTFVIQDLSKENSFITSGAQKEHLTLSNDPNLVQARFVLENVGTRTPSDLSRVSIKTAAESLCVYVNQSNDLATRRCRNNDSEIFSILLRNKDKLGPLDNRGHQPEDLIEIGTEFFIVPANSGNLDNRNPQKPKALSTTQTLYFGPQLEESDEGVDIFTLMEINGKRVIYNTDSELYVNWAETSNTVNLTSNPPKFYEFEIEKVGDFNRIHLIDHKHKTDTCLTFNRFLNKMQLSTCDMAVTDQKFRIKVVGKDVKVSSEIQYSNMNGDQVNPSTLNQKMRVLPSFSAAKAKKKQQQHNKQMRTGSSGSTTSYSYTTTTISK